MIFSVQTCGPNKPKLRQLMLTTLKWPNFLIFMNLDEK